MSSGNLRGHFRTRRDYPGGALVILIAVVACVGLLATAGALWMEASSYRIISNLSAQTTIWRSIQEAIDYKSETVANRAMMERTTSQLQRQVRNSLDELEQLQEELQTEIQRRGRFPVNLHGIWTDDIAQGFTGVDHGILDAVKKYAHDPVELAHLGAAAWDTDVQLAFRGGLYLSPLARLSHDLRTTTTRSLYGASSIVIVALCVFIIGAYLIWARFVGKAFAQMSRSNEQLSTAFNAFGDAACLTDDTGHILVSNGLFSSFFPDRELSRDFRKSISHIGGDRGDIEATIAHLRNEPEFSLGGRELRWNVEDLKTGGWFIVAYDLTQFMKQKKEQLHAQRLDVMGLLSSNVAHDFNNILAALMAKAELLLLTKEHEDGVAEELESIVETCERGRSLTSQLLSYSRKQELKLQPCHARRIYNSFTRQISTPDNIELRVNAPGHFSLMTDPEQLLTAVENLVRNSVEALSGRAGRITLDFSRITGPDGEDMIRISVSDTGGGFTPEALERGTEPFFSTKYEQNGTGLGLAMAAGFVEQCGGYFEMQNDGKGAVCLMNFPAAEITKERETTPAKAPPLKEKTGPDGETVCLLVEDDIRLREFFSTYLRHHFSLIEIAPDLATAQKIIDERDHLDAALCDWNLPDGTCENVVLKLRAKYPEARVSVMTGYPPEKMREQSQDLGFSLLLKPASLSAISESLLH